MTRLLGLAEALEASSKGKTVLIFKLSLLDKDLPNILITLPSIEELQLFQGLIYLMPEQRCELENALCERHVISILVRDWLNNTYAGVSTFICDALIEIGYTSDIDAVNNVLDSIRNLSPYYSEMKQFVTSSLDVSPQELRGIDLHQLLENAIYAEKSLKDKGMLEQPIRLQTTKQSTPGVANIDFEAERKKQLRDMSEGGSSGQVSKSEYYRNHPS